jgi:hypothetical protein
MRRFPPPWNVEKIPGGYVVKDAKGQQLAHIYADNRRIGNSLTEARRDGLREILRNSQNCWGT